MNKNNNIKMFLWSSLFIMALRSVYLYNDFFTGTYLTILGLSVFYNTQNNDWYWWNNPKFNWSKCLEKSTSIQKN